MFMRNLAGVTLVLMTGSVAFAAPSPDASPVASPSSPNLSAEQTGQALKTDSVTIPTPGELFSALAKATKADWAGGYRGPIAMNYKTRSQIALNLGGLIADGFIAVQAPGAREGKKGGGGHTKKGEGPGVREDSVRRR